MDFLDTFPRTLYDIDGNGPRKYDLVTDLTFRIGFVSQALGSIAAYYNYLIQDGDRPDILAEKIYGDSTAHWIIMLANNITDVGYDWPMDNRTFNDYIKSKYGSIETAQTGIHHYEKVIDRHNSTTNTTTTIRIPVDQVQLTVNNMDVPYDTHTNLTDVQDVTTYEVINDTVTETIYRDAISYYDYEQQLNDEKRVIKIIKPEYYGAIVNQKDTLTGVGRLSYRGVT